MVEKFKLIIDKLRDNIRQPRLEEKAIQRAFLADVRKRGIMHSSLAVDELLPVTNAMRLIFY